MAKPILFYTFVAKYKHLMIGRKNEQELLQEAIDKDRAQFIVVYGRRRVGKTFLINEFFHNTYAFKHTAVSPLNENLKPKKNLLKIQLKEFYYSLRSYGLQAGEPIPVDWFDAFHQLQELLETKKNNNEPRVVFLDELPWLDTPRSNFMPAFEHFCNDWVLARRDVKLVVCGSATSWILDKLVNNKGGLYGRVTLPVFVEPFTLKECKEFFQEGGHAMDEYDIVEAYMAFGGIPYYLDQFRKGFSVPQNFDALLYGRQAPLADEFDRLFSSQFANPGELQKIVTMLAQKRSGYTRDEIAKTCGYTTGGGLSRMLSALEKSTFIAPYIPFGEKNVKYRLTDLFCLFYLKHVKDNRNATNYWQSQFNSPAMSAWSGYAFEDVCRTHIRQLKAALGIGDVNTRESSWVVPGTETERGMQIDLVIDRDDRKICLCEMKFSQGKFSVGRDYAEKLQERIRRTMEFTDNEKPVISVLVTTYGIERNDYAGKFQKVITMQDLFRF